MKAIAMPRGVGQTLAPNEVAIPAGVTQVSDGWAKMEAGARLAWARYGTRDAIDDVDPLEVNLGRALWSQLELLPGDSFELELHPSLDLAVRATLDVASPHTGDLTDFLLGELPRDPLFIGGVVEVRHPSLGRVELQVREVTPQPAILSSTTVLDVFERDDTSFRVTDSLADIGGSRAALDELRRQIELPLLFPQRYRAFGIPPPHGAIIHGPPGVGKTLICRALANSMGVSVRAISGGELARSMRGETEKILRDLFRDAAKTAPTLILVDEFDAIGGHRDHMSSQDDVRTVSQLLSLMDGLEHTDGVVVVATTNRLAALDEAFLRPGRFDLQIRIGAPDEGARLEILSIHSRDMPLTKQAMSNLAEIARRTAGYTGADLMHLTRLAALHAVERSFGDRAELAGIDANGLVAVEEGDLQLALAKVQPRRTGSRHLVSAGPAWDDIIGLEDPKESLLQAARSVFDGVTGDDVFPEGVLLYGSAGNGKTMLATSLATKLDANLVLLEPARVFRPWLGESEDTLRDVFERAMASTPSILVIENLTALATIRSAASAERTDDRVKAALTAAIDQALDNGGVLVIGIADRIDQLEPAFTRPGRLGRHIETPNPDREARRRLLMTRVGRDLDEQDVAHAIDLTDGRSYVAVLRGDLSDDRVAR